MNYKTTKKDNSSLCDLWDLIKNKIIEDPEVEKKAKGDESVFKKIIAKNFLNLGRFEHPSL